MKPAWNIQTSTFAVAERATDLIKEENHCQSKGYCQYRDIGRDAATSSCNANDNNNNSRSNRDLLNHSFSSHDSQVCFIPSRLMHFQWYTHRVIVGAAQCNTNSHDSCSNNSIQAIQADLLALTAQVRCPFFPESWFPCHC